MVYPRGLKALEGWLGRPVVVWFGAIFFEGGIRGGGEDLGWKRGWGGGLDW